MPAFGGKFWCIVTDVNDCSENSDTVDTENKTSVISKEFKTKTIKIYPNPTRSNVFIESDLPIDVRVTDAIGKLVTYQKEVKQVNLEPYADGMYIFTIIDKEGNILGIEKINKVAWNR
jgi:hypothetical protein